MRSSVANEKPWSLPSRRAVPARTQSSLALDSCPTSNPAPALVDASAISPRSASVRAVQSFVSIWIAMSRLPPRVLWRRRRRRRAGGWTGVGPRVRGPLCHLGQGGPHSPWSGGHPADAAPLQRDGVVTEGHAQLTDDARQVDAVRLGQPQHLAGAEV